LPVDPLYSFRAAHVSKGGQVRLKINGIEIRARKGETILQAARRAGIEIPTLCYLEGLRPVGSCRICLVEVRESGRSRLAPACATEVAEGMEVTTDTPQLRELRRKVLSLLFIEGNHVCSFCVSNGHCELQTLAYELGMDHVDYPYLWPALPLDASHTRFGIDYNRCVRCGRCVRVCAEVEGAWVWGFSGRGPHTKVAAEDGIPWGLSQGCTDCGKCEEVCPTGAIFPKGVATAELEKDPTVASRVQRWREHG